MPPRKSSDPHLRQLKETDAEELNALIDANRDHLSRWLPWAATQTVEDTLAFIRKARGQLTENDGFQVAIVCEGRIIGVVGYHCVDWANRLTSIGYWLAEDHQGRGTMTELVGTLTDHALSIWELNRLEIRAAAENHKSRAIAERLGFREEGTLRAAERVGDRFLDIVVYSMLAADWRSSAFPPSWSIRSLARRVTVDKKDGRCRRARPCR